MFNFQSFIPSSEQLELSNQWVFNHVLQCLEKDVGSHRLNQSRPVEAKTRTQSGLAHIKG